MSKEEKVDVLQKVVSIMRSNKESLWPAGVSFVQDAKRHGAEQAILWVEMEISKEIING